MTCAAASAFFGALLSGIVSSWMWWRMHRAVLQAVRAEIEATEGALAAAAEVRRLRDRFAELSRRGVELERRQERITAAYLAVAGRVSNADANEATRIVRWRVDVDEEGLPHGNHGE